MTSRSNSALRSGLAAAHGVEARLPLGVRRPAAVDDLAGVREHLVVDREVHVGVEAEDFLVLRDLVVAERRAVRLAGVLLGRRRPADDRAHRDEGRPVGLGLGRGERLLQRHDVLAGVDVLDVPAVGLVALDDVLGERDVGVVLDRDVVVVPEQDQVAELLVPARLDASPETPSSRQPSQAMT